MSGAAPTLTTVRLVVDGSGAGERADRYLGVRVGVPSRTQLQLRLAELRVNDRAVKPSTRLNCGDQVVVVLRSAPAIPALPEPLSLDVLYEDDDVVVIDKPSGMVVHPGSGTRGGTLVNGLLYRYRDLSARFPDSPRPGIVHRLDKDTSGVMVVARHAAAHACLARQFSERTVGKRYLAWVSGRPVPPSGRIATRLRRDAKNPLRVRVSRDTGKPAVTRYRVCESAGDASLMALRPLTGRTHQLRAHMRWLGHPILGDPLYAGRAKGPAARLLLHAHRLAIVLPGGTARTVFEAPPPRGFGLP
ncbi:MAG: RluA family pseudouridine synthase [Spirochaetaceae bacterium]|nr:RluA family pseudouridine synthase [Spirochaetaceae bacterium]